MLKMPLVFYTQRAPSTLKQISLICRYGAKHTKFLASILPCALFRHLARCLPPRRTTHSGNPLECVCSICNAKTCLIYLCKGLNNHMVVCI